MSTVTIGETSGESPGIAGGGVIKLTRCSPQFYNHGNKIKKKGGFILKKIIMEIKDISEYLAGFGVGFLLENCFMLLMSIL